MENYKSKLENYKNTFCVQYIYTLTLKVTYPSETQHMFWVRWKIAIQTKACQFAIDVKANYDKALIEPILLWYYNVE